MKEEYKRRRVNLRPLSALNEAKLKFSVRTWEDVPFITHTHRWTGKSQQNIKDSHNAKRWLLALELLPEK